MISNRGIKSCYTVLSTTPVASYPIGFRFFEDSDVKVALLQEETGQVLVVSPADYTINHTGVGGATGVEITTLSFLSGYTFPTGTTLLVIYRATPYEQMTDLRTGEYINAENLEESLDQAIAMIQELADQVDRCIKASITSGGNFILPETNERKAKLLAFNAAGDVSLILPTEIVTQLVSLLETVTVNSITSVGELPSFVLTVENEQPTEKLVFLPGALPTFETKQVVAFK